MSIACGAYLWKMGLEGMKWMNGHGILEYCRVKEYGLCPGTSLHCCVMVKRCQDHSTSLVRLAKYRNGRWAESVWPFSYFSTVLSSVASKLSFWQNGSLSKPYPDLSSSASNIFRMRIIGVTVKVVYCLWCRHSVTQGWSLVLLLFVGCECWQLIMQIRSSYIA